MEAISIHAAQEGCDPSWRQTVNITPIFQSTQPKRAATAGFSAYFSDSEISIHAAQEGCDFKIAEYRYIINKFQSTQPKRAATDYETDLEISKDISIHAAQEGCDSIRINCNYYSFYSYKSAKLTFLLN